MDALLQDVRYALRTLIRSPGFTIVAVICLALGIGVNTTIYSVVDTAIVRPFPFTDPEQLVIVSTTQATNRIDDASVSYPNYQDVKAEGQSFSDIAALAWRSLVLQDGAEPERLEGALVSWNLFPMLGVQPIVGRGFRKDEDRPGAAGAVLISYDVWQRRYQGDPSIVGRSILLDGRPHTVAGVMPERFMFPNRQLIWAPLAPIEHAAPRRDLSLFVIGRLKPEVVLDQARQEMAALGKRLEARHADNVGYGMTARPLRDEFIPTDVRLVVLTMMGAVSLVLLIACANLANLMLARATARHREIAVRAALGAGRWRVVRQLLTESVVLAMMSVPLGILLAYWGLDLLDRGIPPERPVPYYIHWKIDGRALLYAVTISVVTGLIFGLTPALQASRGSLHESLKEGRGSGTAARRNLLRSGFVVAEVALSVVLLVGASLFVRSFLELQRASGGFDTAPLLSLRFYMPGEAYQNDEALVRRVDDVVRRIEELPGVEAATASNLIPLSGGGDEGPIEVDGRPARPGEEPRIFYAGVTPHFFRTLDVPLLRGRDVTEAEGMTRSRVAVINRSMAARFWSVQGAVGQKFRQRHDVSNEWITVIGVVPDISNDSIADERSVPSAYLPYPYLTARNTGLTIRVTGDPARLTANVRQALRASDPGLPLFSIATMEKVRRLGFWQDRLFGWMFSIFGLLALLLAAVGVYGVLSYSVARRTQEIGVRVALGARERDVIRLIVGHGMKLALIGLGLGLLGSFAITRVISSILYNVSPTDPLSFAGTAIFLTGIAALASYLPARHALKVDPVEALRTE